MDSGSVRSVLVQRPNVRCALGFLLEHVSGCSVRSEYLAYLKLFAGKQAIDGIANLYFLVAGVASKNSNAGSAAGSGGGVLPVKGIVTGSELNGKDVLPAAAVVGAVLPDQTVNGTGGVRSP